MSASGHVLLNMPRGVCAGTGCDMGACVDTCTIIVWVRENGGGVPWFCSGPNAKYSLCISSPD